jgi:beta-lactamase regulating signal transducer with metallopeptidase domain
VTPSPPSETLIFAYIFAITLAITIVVYVLRGFGISGFTALPGAVIWLLILLSIATGLIYGVQKTRRY